MRKRRVGRPRKKAVARRVGKAKRRTPAKAKVVTRWRTRTKTVNKYRTRPLAGRKAKRSTRRRSRRLGGSLLGANFNVKNLLKVSAIGAVGGFAMKYASEKMQEYLPANIPEWAKSLADIGLGLGAVYAVRKKPKYLKYVIPASITHIASTFVEAYNKHEAGLLLNGGATVTNKQLNGGANIRNLSASVQNHSQNLRQRTHRPSRSGM